MTWRYRFTERMSGGFRGHGQLATVLMFLAVGLVLALFVASIFGTVTISLPDMVKMTLERITPLDFEDTWRNADEIIFFQIRLPRAIGAALIGAALATAGVLFQGLLRNPMADPYIIGTSSGAALGATIAMILPINLTFLGFGLVPLAAFGGALGAVILVYNLARVGGKTPVVSMLLAGFVVNAMLGAVIFFMMAISDRLDLNIRSVYMFLMGRVSVVGWEPLVVIAPLVIAGVVTARLFAYNLNAFSLGEEGAAYVGIEVERDKLLILALGSLLTAAAVSIGGLIGFVGLVMPHTVRLLLGPDHRLLLPASALAGAIFLVIADLLARVVLAPAEIPVGIVTAIVGAPFFLYLLRRSRREYAL